MSLKVLKAGLLDTIQDQGRYGYRHLGINPGGVMDTYASQLANAILGQEMQAPVIEIHFPASVYLFTSPAIICITGADFSPVVNGTAIPLHQPVYIHAGAVLSFKKVISGARCYLACYGSLQLPPWLNSYSTNLKAAAGGLHGRRLLPDDEIQFSNEIVIPTFTYAVKILPWRATEVMQKQNEISFIKGNEWSWLTETSQKDFLQKSFSISSTADRMGYRLAGEKLVAQNQSSLVSSAVGFGTIQLLPNGQLVVLMADHQTTGGYPRIAHIIVTHLPAVAQLLPGEQMLFTETTIQEAQALLVQRQEYLLQIKKTCNLKLQHFLHEKN